MTASGSFAAGSAETAFQGEDRQQATLLPFGVKPLMQSHPQHHQRTITVLPPS